MNRLVLAIETSCDETAAAVYSSEKKILSNVLFSQTELHKDYGGVIPELASRSHLEKINHIVERALIAADCTLADIDIVAVTKKPGLPGSLLVGVSFAKGIAWVHKKPLIGIDHLEGHIFSSFLEHELPFPFLCLSASGGHTAVYLVRDFGEYTVLGSTRDDAAGEAFDKIAKLMGLGYPGGPIIEQMASQAHLKDYFHYPRSSAQTLDFSFSGLKTAVFYDLIARGWFDVAKKEILPTMTLEEKQQVASSLLLCVNDIFVHKIKKALKLHPEVKAISFVGGVSCNKFITKNVSECAYSYGLQFASPSPAYCTDNAAMIAFVGNYKADQGFFDDYSLDIF